MIAALRKKDEDVAYEEQRQRLVDAEAEGLRAGRLGLGAGLGTCYSGPEAKAFMKGFQQGAAERANGDLARARRSCYGCNCRGVGRCVGDAQ